MFYMNINQLKERISLLALQSRAGTDGREVRTVRVMRRVWAKVTPQPRLTRLVSTLMADTRPRQRTVYKVVIRAIPEKEFRWIRAVQWREQELEVVEPFTDHPHAPHYLQAFCVEEAQRSVGGGGEDEEPLDGQQRRSCQREQNKDNMKYRQDYSIPIRSKQKVNTVTEDDMEDSHQEKERQEEVRGPKKQDRKGDDHAGN